MIYTIYRTSDFLGENKPCKKAELQSIDELYRHYTIEINSLEELQALIHEVGEINIDEDTIAIYDSYIE